MHSVDDTGGDDREDGDDFGDDNGNGYYHDD